MIMHGNRLYCVLKVEPQVRVGWEIHRPRAPASAAASEYAWAGRRARITAEWETRGAGERRVRRREDEAGR